MNNWWLQRSLRCGWKRKRFPLWDVNLRLGLCRGPTESFPYYFLGIVSWHYELREMLTLLGMPSPSSLKWDSNTHLSIAFQKDQVRHHKEVSMKKSEVIWRFLPGQEEKCLREVNCWPEKGNSCRKLASKERFTSLSANNVWLPASRLAWKSLGVATPSYEVTCLASLTLCNSFAHQSSGVMWQTIERDRQIGYIESHNVLEKKGPRSSAVVTEDELSLMC